MKFLAAPWRWEFISKILKRDKGCVFCKALKEDPKDSLVCYIGRNAFVILNKYPYNTGHLLIVPKAHVNSPLSIDQDVSSEMWELMTRSIDILKNKFNPDGFNLGMNLGKAAGAGIKDHFHLHIVPRWQGDANFMPIIGKTDVVSYSIQKIHKILYNEFSKDQKSNGE